MKNMSALDYTLMLFTGDALELFFFYQGKWEKIS